jgi:hypothetical protein
MATKKTTKESAKSAKKTATKAAPAKKGAPAKKAAPAKKEPKARTEKADKGAPKARHPLGRVKERFGTKEDLVKTLVEPLAAADEDTDIVKDRLLKASNQQLLRLQRVVTTVKEKWGSRDKLIAAIGAAMKKTKDQDYLAKLATFSLPRLLDLGISAERASRASR